MGIRTTKARTKKIFSKKASKSFKKSLNKKQENELKANVNNAIATEKAIKSVKQTNKASKHKEKLNSHLN